MGTIESNVNPKRQMHIDAIANDLMADRSVSALPSAEVLAQLLDLCPEQDVWMYEPDPADADPALVFATFRLQSSRGVVFHMGCQLSSDSQVLEWIGPFDISVPDGVVRTRVNRALAA